MRNIRFEVRPPSGELGAELLGIDLSDSLDAEGAAEIRKALNEHGVVFFRNQLLSAALIAARRRKSGRSSEIRDTLIVGIVVADRADFATRKVPHFQDLDVRVVDPSAS